MTLDQWMTSTGMTPDQLGRELGVSGEAVRRYRLGSRSPDALIQEAIVRVTGGAVTVLDLHDTRLRFLKSQNDPASPEAA